VQHTQAEVSVRFEEHELSMADGAEPGHVRQDGLLLIRAFAVAFGVPHAGEEELLPVAVGLREGYVVEALAGGVCHHAPSVTWR
jgi:hypothetical protein